MERPRFFNKDFELKIIIIFILVFLLSYSYKFGGRFYQIVCWVFLLSMILTLSFSVMGLLMYPLSLYFYKWYYAYIYFLPLAFNTIYLLVSVLVFSVFISNGIAKIKKDINLYTILFLFFIVIASTLLNGFNIGFGNWEFTHWVHAVLVYLIISSTITTRKRLRIFCFLLVFFAGALAFRAYNHTFTYNYTIWQFENNDLARHFSFYVFLLLGLFLAESHKYLKYIPFVVMGFVGQTITQLGSRATFISVAIGGIFTGIFNFKKKSLWVIGVLGLILLIFFTPPEFFRDFRSVFEEAPQGVDSQDGSIVGRTEILLISFEAFKDNPILGYGVYPWRANQVVARYGGTRSLHNSYMEVAIQMGFLGLIPYILLFVFSIYLCFKARRIAKDDFVKYIASGVMFGLISLSINQFMLNEPWVVTVFIPVGLSSAVYYLAKHPEKEENVKVEVIGFDDKTPRRITPEKGRFL
jgi:O-antigen ligase